MRPAGQGAVRRAARHAQDGAPEKPRDDQEDGAIRRLRRAGGAAAVRRVRHLRARVQRRAGGRGRCGEAVGARPARARRAAGPRPDRRGELQAQPAGREEEDHLVRAGAVHRAPGQGRPGRARGEGARTRAAPGASASCSICPYCLGLWASGGFHAGLLFAPRATRFSASVLTAMTISDFLQIAYRAAEERGARASPSTKNSNP